MPPHNVVWPEAYSSCPVCLCMRAETLLTWYLAEYLTPFHQTHINSALWDRVNASQFGVKRSKVKVTVELSMLETALSGLVNTISWKVLVGFSPNLCQSCIMGQRWMRWIWGSTGQQVQGHGGITCWNHHCTGGGTVLHVSYWVRLSSSIFPCIGVYKR